MQKVTEGLHLLVRGRDKKPPRESGNAFERIICHAHKLRSHNLV
jgi:hypothetical protein